MFSYLILRKLFLNLVMLFTDGGNEVQVLENQQAHLITLGFLCGIKYVKHHSEYYRMIFVA